MKVVLKVSLFFVLLIFIGCSKSEENKSLQKKQVLWYTSPAEDWNNALPVGNGRLGAMVYGNLLDVHPPFQIDGNFGFTAGVAEALLQSHEGFLRILPTLPNNWNEGSIKGLKARGNILVDISWKEGKLEALTLQSPINKTVKVVYDDIELEIELTKGEHIGLDVNLKKKKGTIFK